MELEVNGKGKGKVGVKVKVGLPFDVAAEVLFPTASLILHFDH
jgi:hypothetical protein